MGNIWLWVGFNVFVLAMLALDLGVFHKTAHEVKFKEALTWSGVWITLALIFNVALYYWKGSQPATEFLTGYLLEKSLSIDNVFVFLLIFSSLKIPTIYQHRVLFWGILGALVLRVIFIFAGVALLERFHWIIYIFGIFLVFTGIKMALPKKEESPLESNITIRALKKIMPVSSKLDGENFFTHLDGKRAATPLFVALLLLESTDVIFAMDSIPAILAVTSDPFLVYTSNVFAILGLRSLYFAFAGIANLFHYIQYGLAVILVFVGGKMLLVEVYKIPIVASLVVIAAVLLLSVLASVLWPKKVVNNGI